MVSIGILFRRLFKGLEKRATETLVPGSYRQAIFLALILLFIGGIHPHYNAIAATNLLLPNGTGVTQEVGREVAESVAKAAALYGQFKPSEALLEFEKALALAPQDPEVLVWIARTYIDIGDMIPDTVADWRKQRLKRYRKAEHFARAAVEANPKSTWPHFFLAVALGKVAEFSGIKKQIALASEIRSATDMALNLDPNNGFAYHVLGVWHRRMAEINKTERLLAQLFLLGSVPAGRLSDSVRYLKQALEHNPDIINHHLELAKTYQTLGKHDLARQHLKTVAKLPIRFSDDKTNKRKAKQLQRDISESSGG